MFDLLGKYAHDDDKTKAIFEHCRNLLTAGAFLAAGTWLGKRPFTADFLKHPWLNLAITLGGGLVGLAGLALLYIAVINAQAKMVRAGFKDKSLLVLWPLHIFLVVYGVFAFFVLH